MSYARFGRRSDVYVFASRPGVVRVLLLPPRGRRSVHGGRDTADQMLDHLREHERAGHKVQRHTIRRLGEEALSLSGTSAQFDGSER